MHTEKTLLISEHARERAKERFSFNESTIKRLARKALRGMPRHYLEGQNASFTHRYKHYNFIFTDTNNTITLITVTNLSTQKSFKSQESIKNAPYIKGVKATNKFNRGAYS